jgi:hypothetical protein
MRASAVAAEIKYASRNRRFNAPPMKLTQRPGAGSENLGDLRAATHDKATLLPFI